MGLVSSLIANTLTGLGSSYYNYIKNNPKPTTGTTATPTLPSAIASPTLTAPTYTPTDEPEMMDWGTAIKQATARVNPTYDSLRSRYEQSFSDQREQVPQLLAARFGMAGIRGGRRESAEYGTTQNENAAIGDVENNRVKAINDTASEIQSGANSEALQRYQAAEAANLNKYNSLYQTYKDAVQAKQQDLTNKNAALTAQGLVPMTSESDEPSVQIHKLGQLWQSTSDPKLKEQYNQMAIKIAQQAGLVPEGYTGSVNGLGSLSSAGTPTYERLAGEAAGAADAAQQDFENQMALEELRLKQAETNYAINKPYFKPSSGGSGRSSSGSSSGGKKTKAEQTKINAIAWINNNKKVFGGKYPAKNMYAQVQRNIAAGAMDPTLGAAILSQLKSLYMR